mmetsp:Transcript_40849/g.97379  ORF Transcript_40849/g.97379 Transcript_40849/m.97379 type:complete len:223 (-) Transcript_40849:28-696(-)
MLAVLSEGLIECRQHRLVNAHLPLRDHRQQVRAHAHEGRRLRGEALHEIGVARVLGLLPQGQLLVNGEVLLVFALWQRQRHVRHLVVLHRVAANGALQAVLDAEPQRAVGFGQLHLKVLHPRGVGPLWDIKELILDLWRRIDFEAHQQAGQFLGSCLGPRGGVLRALGARLLGVLGGLLAFPLGGALQKGFRGLMLREALVIILRSTLGTGASHEMRSRRLV